MYWFLEQALALPWAGTKASSPYLGRLLPQYSYPFRSVLYISSVPAAGLGVYPHYLAEAQDEPHVSSRNKSDVMMALSTSFFSLSVPGNLPTW